MAIVIVESKKVCDMCGRESDHFIDGSGEKFTANMGYVQSQSDRWVKIISVKVGAAIPYHPSDDICINCLKDALEQIVIGIEKEQ